jgi:hypothetical protein
MDCLGMIDPPYMYRLLLICHFYHKALPAESLTESAQGADVSKS